MLGVQFGDDEKILRTLYEHVFCTRPALTVAKIFQRKASTAPCDNCKCRAHVSTCHKISRSCLSVQLWTWSGNICSIETSSLWQKIHSSNVIWLWKTPGLWRLNNTTSLVYPQYRSALQGMDWIKKHHPVPWIYASCKKMPILFLKVLEYFLCAVKKVFVHKLMVPCEDLKLMSQNFCVVACSAGMHLSAKCLLVKQMQSKLQSPTLKSTS